MLNSGVTKAQATQILIFSELMCNLIPTGKIDRELKAITATWLK